MQTMTDKQGFEIETCTRCGGSGNYSYCQMHGSTCFKCAGVGKTYTKRGAAAKAYLKTLRSKLAKDVVVGDVIWKDNYPFGKGAWEAVTEIKDGGLVKSGTMVNGEWIYTEHRHLHINTVSSGLYTFPDHPVRVRQTPEEAARTLAAALAYQDTLTATGKPRKGKARAASAEKVDPSTAKAIEEETARHIDADA